MLQALLLCPFAPACLAQQQVQHLSQAAALPQLQLNGVGVQRCACCWPLHQRQHSQQALHLTQLPWLFARAQLKPLPLVSEDKAQGGQAGCQAGRQGAVVGGSDQRRRKAGVAVRHPWEAGVRQATTSPQAEGGVEAWSLHWIRHPALERVLLIAGALHLPLQLSAERQLDVAPLQLWAEAQIETVPLLISACVLPAAMLPWARNFA